MTHDEKEIKRKLRILKHAEYSGNIAKTCRYFGVARSLFYLWRDALHIEPETSCYLSGFTHLLRIQFCQRWKDSYPFRIIFPHAD